MNANLLQNLLCKAEDPKLEFKHEWYSGANRLDDKGWGELLKDIIALANGNVGYVGRSAYLIIGAADEDPILDKTRETSHVPAIGMLAQLQKLRDTTLRKLHRACSPSLPDLIFEFVEVEPGKNLLVIKIPPSAGPLKLDRDLNTRGMRFRKGTVLFRVGQDVSVADPTEIGALQQEFKRHFGQGQGERQPKRILHNLPQPDYIRFVGRKEEIEQLCKLLHPQDRAWVIVIDGIGGIGKSALALEVAHRYLDRPDPLSEEEFFDAIIWVSAKSATLTAEGISPRQQASRTLEDIYKTVAITLEKDDITQSRLDAQNILVRRALTQQRTLLIIDNLETIDDERVNGFIRELPDPTKCIVTTRHRIDVAHPIRLTGLPRMDALELISQECGKKNVTVTDEQADLLYKRTGGVPLAVVWSIAQMGYGYNVDVILRRLGHPSTDIIRYCFEGAIERIRGNAAHLLLIAIALANRASRSFLKTATDLPELDLDEGLVELEKLSLVNKQKDMFETLPLVSQFTLSELAFLPGDTLENLIVQIAEYKHSSDPFLRAEVYVSLSESTREKIAKFIDNQLWGYAQGADEQSVYYYMTELEKLGGNTAISTFKWIAEGGLADYLYYTPEPDRHWTAEHGIYGLMNLGQIKYLFDLLERKPDWPSKFFIAEALGKAGKSDAIPAIEEFLSSTNNDQLIKPLTEAKRRILTRVSEVG